MESLSRIPHEILGAIFLKTDTKPEVLAAVSKEWNFVVKKALDSLIQSYEASAALKPYIKSAETAQKALKEKHRTEKIEAESTTQDVVRNIQTIKSLFHHIMQKAQQMGYEKKELINLQTLSAAHLEEVANWIKEQEAKNLNIFALEIKIPAMVSFLNTIKDLPPLEKAEKIKTWMKENKQKLEQIRELDLGSRKLTALPSEIKYFTGLQKLDLEDNQLTSLPSEIGSLAQLQQLDLENNQLTSLPSEIGSLVHLEELYVGYNELTSLPIEIGSLAQLEMLDLSNNQLTSLPSEIGFLTNLEKLHLSNNQLTSLPSEIRSLAQLKLLDLGNNQLTSLPNEKIGSLKQLHQLYVEHNKLTSIPNEIGSLKGLFFVNFSDNNIDAYPSRIGRLSQSRHEQDGVFKFVKQKT
jgi:hypothetical protein